MKPRNFYKTMAELPIGYLERFSQYLEQNSKEFFSEDNFKANSEDDFEYFGTDVKTDRDHLVKYGELMIVDLENGNEDWFALCKPTKRKYKLSSGRLVNLKVIDWLVNIDDLDYWRAGYYLLPKNF